MFCPACGVAASEDQKFCRVCGMHLQVVYHLVAEYLREATSEDEPAEKKFSLQDFGLTLSFIGGGGLIMLAFTVLLILSTVPPQSREWSPLWSQLALISFGMIFVGLCLFRLPWLYTRIFGQTNRDETSKLVPQENTQVPSSLITEGKNSITEHPTRSLDALSPTQRHSSNPVLH
ncbi:MAG: zinc ribbon domain-containing protein [Acidobacteria bacterium]|nr:zinc ribbon domain-containing protein [Acidobacteriota bacterium]